MFCIVFVIKEAQNINISRTRVCIIYVHMNVHAASCHVNVRGGIPPPPPPLPACAYIIFSQQICPVFEEQRDDGGVTIYGRPIQCSFARILHKQQWDRHREGGCSRQVRSGQVTRAAIKLLWKCLRAVTDIVQLKIPCFCTSLYSGFCSGYFPPRLCVRTLRPFAVVLPNATTWHT